LDNNNKEDRGEKDKEKKAGRGRLRAALEDSTAASSSSSSHSKKIQQKLVQYRRDQVFSLSTKGYSQPKIANILDCSQGLVSLDLSFLRQRTREALADYLENKLPLIFQESMAGISDVISQTWEIINNPNVSNHDRLHALSLVADCNERRLDMASNGSIVENGIRFVQDARQRLVTITPESAKEMLHEEGQGQENQQQPQTQSHWQDNNSDNDNHRYTDNNNKRRRQKTTNSVF
jgi:hypothetical protein